LVHPPVDDAPSRSERGFFGDVVAAFGDLTKDWSGWIRGLLTLLVLLMPSARSGTRSTPDHPASRPSRARGVQRRRGRKS
jgi:hypothetical protein